MARAAVALLVASAAVGCGGEARVSPRVAAMRAAAVRLLFADANATALPGAYDRKVLRRRMRRYVASAWLDGRVARYATAIARNGGRRDFGPWTESITVGRWDSETLTDRVTATVVYTGYDTVYPGFGQPALPMERVTVRMVREHGRWRLATWDSRWLTPGGPMGDPGTYTIRHFPLRVVFRNPRPRGWRYRGPRIPPDAAGEVAPE